jgi:hypothetical protein
MDGLNGLTRSGGDREKMREKQIGANNFCSKADGSADARMRLFAAPECPQSHLSCM